MLEPDYNLSFNNISANDLQSPVRLRQLCEHAVRRRWIKDTIFDRRQFFSLAEYCHRKGKTPGKLFVYCIKNRSFSAISDDDDRKGYLKYKKAYYSD